MPLYAYRCAEGHAFDRMLPLARYAEPQACDCGAAARKVLTAVRVISDAIEPQYGPDGKLHDSRSSLRAACMPSGNPKGERFHELGNDTLPAFEPPKIDEAALVDDIKHAFADAKAGKPAPIPVSGIHA